MRITKGIAIGTLALSIGFGSVAPARAQRTLVLNCTVQGDPTAADDHNRVDLLCTDPTGICGQGAQKGPILIPDGDELLDFDDAPLTWPNVVTFPITCEDPATGTVSLTSFGGTPDMAGGVWVSKNESCLPYLSGDWNAHVRDRDKGEVVLTIHNYSGPHIINHGNCASEK